MRRLAELSISVPGILPAKAHHELRRVQNILSHLDELPDIKLLCDTQYKCPNSMVIRINVDSDIFNDNLEVFKALKTAYPRAKVRRYCVQSGGGYSNTGYATITTLLTGKKPKPVFIKYRGHRACGLHEIYWLSAGFVINMKYWNKGIPKFTGDIQFFKCSFKSGYIEKTIAKTRGEAVNNYEIEITDPITINIPAILKPAIEAAMKKCLIYHCRHAVDW